MNRRTLVSVSFFVEKTALFQWKYREGESELLDMSTVDSSGKFRTFACTMCAILFAHQTLHGDDNDAGTAL